MIRKRGTRRLLGVTLVVIGALLMWSAASPVWGGVVFIVAIAIEALGIHLEHRQELSARDRGEF